MFAKRLLFNMKACRVTAALQSKTLNPLYY